MVRPAANYSGSDLCAKSAREVVRLLKAGDVSPRELLQAALDRIAAVNGPVNATVIQCEERAQASIDRLPAHARESEDHPGWLAGLTIGIKDLIDVAGIPNTCGSPALKTNIPQKSDALIDRLEKRGAVIGGKTNTPEFGAGANTFNEVFGITRNPYNIACNAGGSSGGSAAALATGQFWLCHGSDLAGSLRTPASFCAVVGLRPSPGRAGGGPVDSAFSLEPVQGPMARNVGDVALFLDSMCGFDVRHPISLPEPPVPFQAILKTDPGPIKIAFTEDLGGFAPVEKEIRDTLRGAIHKLPDRRLEIVESYPELQRLNETYLTLRGIHYGAVTDNLPAAAKRHFKRTLRENVDFGRNLDASQIYQGLRGKTRIYHTMRRFFEDIDVLAMPNTGIAPGPVDIEYPREVDGVKMHDYVDWLRFSFLATVAGLPSLSLPAGFTGDGLPVGIQLIAGPRNEARLLQVAFEIERRLDLGSSPIDPIM